MQVCHSQAWDSKIVTSAWWVYPHQVTKTAPTGEYLTVGSFMIRGKKNYLPPHPLIMGFGMLFRLDESSLGSHLNERRVRGEEEGTNDADESEPFKEISDSGSDSEKEVLDGKAISEPSSTMDLSTETFLSVASSNGLNVSDTAMNTDDCCEKSSSINYSSSEKVSAASGQTSVASNTNLEDLLDKALELGSGTSSVKYGLQASQEAAVEEHEHNVAKAVQREKPYVSKAERRKLKKSGVTAHVEEGNNTEDNESVGQNDLTKNSKPSSGKISRGQKGKLKKMKEKYADQDEEERSIRMALLAVSSQWSMNPVITNCFCQ